LGSIKDVTAGGRDDAASEKALRRKNRMRVLLAEDDDEMRALLAQVLEKEGYDVIEASDGSELIDFVGLAVSVPDIESAPDVIISDHRMPGWSGLEVLAGVRSLGSAVPFILITAFGNARLRDQAMRMGATAVIDKPVEVDIGHRQRTAVAPGPVNLEIGAPEKVAAVCHARERVFPCEVLFAVQGRVQPRQ
jgi:CheY-like chemotaxis protein